MDGLIKILPFLDKSPKVRIQESSVDVKDLYVTEHCRQLAVFAMNLISSSEDAYEKYFNEYKDRVFKVTYVKPLNMAILDADDITIGFVLALFSRINAVITTVHYTKPACEISFTDDHVATMKNIIGYDYEPFPTIDFQFVQAAMDNKAIFAEPIFGSFMEINEPTEILESVDYHNYGPIAILEGYQEPLFGFSKKLDECLNSGKFDYGKIYEAIADFDDLSVTNAFDAGKEGTQDRTVRALDVTLEAYLLSSDTDARVPMLVGASGVAKSARVKALCDKHGFRLVDFRLAFMERADVLGFSLTDKYMDVDGSGVKTKVGESCPACGLTACTDGYIDYCAQAAELIEKKLATETDEGVRKNLTIALEKFNEGKKIPVLFLDEINRAPDGIRGPFTKILSDKEFAGIPMKKAKILAASNIMIDDSGQLTKNDDLVAAWSDTTEDGNDAAFADRFTTIPITPSSVRADWRDWGESMDKKGGSKIHPAILDFLKLYEDFYYDMTPMEDAAMDSDLEVTVTPYPNYRTWDLLSQHLYNLSPLDSRQAAYDDYKNDSKQPCKNVLFDKNTVKGLIGDRATDRFLAFIEGKGAKDYSKSVKMSQDDKDDPLFYRMKLAFKTNTPMMMVTPSAIGKSSRIKQLQKETGCLLFEANLSEQTRSDVMGTADIISINEFALDGALDLPSDLLKDLDALIEQKVADNMMPSRVTKKFPKGTLYKAVKDAVDSGKELLIHFDEMNRVTDASIMSTVFEAVSDHRLMGVNFDPSRVRIFCSCNLGDNMEGAKKLDPAFAARFSIYRKRVYEMSDVKAYIRYMHSAKFHPAIIDWFENHLTADEQLECLSSVELRDMSMSAPSSRGIKDLSNGLKQPTTSKLLTGALIFRPRNIQAIMNSMSRSVTDCKSEEFKNDFQGVAKDVKKYANVWAGLGSNQKLTMKSGAQLTTQDVVDTVLDLIGKMENEISVNGNVQTQKYASGFFVLCKFMAGIEGVENEGIDKIRKAHFGAYLGIGFTNPITGLSYQDFSSKFLEYYNEVSGKLVTNYDLPDCTTIAIWQDYLDQQTNKISNEVDRGDAIADLAIQWYKHFKTQYANLAKDIILSTLSCVSQAEVKSNIAVTLAMNPDGEQLLIMAEQDQGYDFALKLLTICNMRQNCTQAILDNAKNVVVPKL